MRNMSDHPSEQPTPDSLNLWGDLQDMLLTPEWKEFSAAIAERADLQKRDAEIQKKCAEIMANMGERVEHRFDITPQAKALRFEIREAALLANQCIHVDARMSRALMAVSEKLHAIINEE
jgi:hypothetical protein